MTCLTAHRRSLLHTSLALLLGCSALAAHAQNDALAAAGWPAKPVRLVVPFTPGGAADTLARSLGEVLQREFKQPFVTDNRPGAGGNIGAENVAKSAGDGYTWLVGLDTTFSINPFIYKSMPFKNAELRALMVVASQGSIIVVSQQSGIRTLDQFIERGRKQGLSLSSAGYGTPGHLGSAILTNATGVKVNHVPYKGNAPASTAVLAGEVEGGVLSASVLVPHINAGKVTALAITTARRNPLMPNVPTVGELGHANLGMEVLFGIWVPASTPQPLVQKMQAALEQAGKDAQFQERLRSNDLFYEGLAGDAAERRMQAQTERNRAVIQATGLKME